MKITSKFRSSFYKSLLIIIGLITIGATITSCRAKTKYGGPTSDYKKVLETDKERFIYEEDHQV